MIQGLKNASLAGRDEWPKNATKACNCLSEWEGEEHNVLANCDHQETSLSNDEKDKGQHKEKERDTEPQSWNAKMTCRNCNEEDQ
jgi:hypothetical protein